MSTHTITFLPKGVTVQIEDGETILRAALDNGVDLEHACGGFCACTTCHVVIKDGDDSLSEMEEDEEDRLDTCEGVTLHSRLGCQSEVHGDLVVQIPPKPF